MVYNPPLPTDTNFSLTPPQQKLEQDYKEYLAQHFEIKFNNLFTITNIPIGRTKQFLQRQDLHDDYLAFLATNYNGATLDHVMCLNELSIDYLGNVYDCDFNQMENIKATTPTKETLTIAKLLELDNLDVINDIKTANYCYGCTGGNWLKLWRFFSLIKMLNKIGFYIQQVTSSKKRIAIAIALLVIPPLCWFTPLRTVFDPQLF